jgi:subtilase family serine protease
MKKFFGVSVRGFSFLIFSLLFTGMNFPVSTLAQAPTSLPEQALAHIPVCPGRGSNNSVVCNSHVVVGPNGRPVTGGQPTGYGPNQFLGAYGLGSGAVASKSVIAIVDAYDQPNITKDLSTYSKQYGLIQLGSCAVSTATAALPCFQKVGQNGGVRYPATNAGWALEISLDVETAHAVCQNCSIVLVEANSNSYADLFSAFDTAVGLGANVISNSYGSAEFSTETGYDFHFSNAVNSGAAVTFSSGDGGYGTEYPAASPFVTAVGGTTLKLDSANNWLSESAWKGAGSGCSAFEAQSAFQASLGLSGCSGRMVADVSADADPSTGASVYDSINFQGQSGWFKVGGTSLASPIIAASYALANNASTISPANQYLYSHISFLRDILSGTNGTCSVSFLCNSGAGFDGPTGLGTPLGLGAF